MTDNQHDYEENKAIMRDTYGVPIADDSDIDKAYAGGVVAESAKPGTIYDVNSLYPAPYVTPEKETWRMWLSRVVPGIRKAITAGGLAFAGAFGVGIVVITGDGVWTWDETVPLIVVSLGTSLSTGLATWAVPNDK